MATKPPIAATETEGSFAETGAATPAAPVADQQPSDPIAGGRYLRDPATGALTANPETFSQPE